MSEKESYDTEREARQGVVAHPQRADRAEGLLSRFLSIIGYQTQRRQKTSKGTTSDPSAGGVADGVGQDDTAK